jgi:hypothetical protein
MFTRVKSRCAHQLRPPSMPAVGSRGGHARRFDSYPAYQPTLSHQGARELQLASYVGLRAGARKSVRSAEAYVGSAIAAPWLNRKMYGPADA